MLRDPIVIEPAGFDQASAWNECQRDAARYRKDGREFFAAACADPGVVSCPACGESYWNWGSKQRCVVCSFEYPTDWWPMYSWGVGAAKNAKARYKHDERMRSSAYYRYGFEHPVADAWSEHNKIDWRTATKEASRG